MREDIKHLPKPIRKLTQKRAKQKPLETGYFGFKWMESKEGYSFWEQIFMGNYKLFYKKYSKKKKESIEELMKKAPLNYVFGATNFSDIRERFVAMDYRGGEYESNALEKYPDLLPSIYATSLRKLLKRVIKNTKK